MLSAVIFYEKRFFMLRSILSGGINLQMIIQILLEIPIILFSLSAHECAHGFVAHLFGDDTAKNYGRLTLNPIKHIDPIGLVSMFLLGFGWAKPVPINTRYMKHARVGFAVSSLAGPVSNLLIAFFSMIFEYLFSLISMLPAVYGNGTTTIAVNVVISFFYLSVVINASLAIFNLIPIPPLDGSRLITMLLPRKLAVLSFQYERYIQLALFLLLWLGAFTGVITRGVSAVIWVLEWVVSRLFLIFF